MTLAYRSSGPACGGSVSDFAWRENMRDGETILVVDDEPNIRTILTYLLEQEGFVVRTAASGAEALEALALALPSLVILDLMMPEVDGFEVLTSMRNHYRTHNVPVILLTAKGDMPHKVHGLREGANDYLVKPFVHEELILRVRNMLRFTRNQRDANPLTGLPGNLAIDEELKRRLDAREPFGFLYIDLDNFKPFNDHYGYSRGDRMLTLLAECLQRSAADVTRDVFLGHVGGDDFVAVVPASEAVAVARRVVEEFETQKRFLYDPEDWARGWIEIRDRTGDVRRVEPVSVTVAVVVDANGEFEHLGRVNSVAAELKRFGKSRPGSTVVEERREAVATAWSPAIVGAEPGTDGERGE